MLPVSNKATRNVDPATAPARSRRRAQRAKRGTDPGLLSSLVHVLRPDPPPLADDVATVPVPVDRSPASRVAEQLIEHCHESVILLHHRRTPRVKPHIDHLAIAPSGVWIVHSRRNQGRVATRKPMFGDPKLTIGGRERMDLLENLGRQVGYVEAALSRDHPDVQVRSALCFVDTEAPLLRTLYLGSYLFFGAPAIATHLNSDGPFSPARVEALAALLEAKFPPA